MITPLEVLTFLSKRRTQPETMCLIDNHFDSRAAWLGEFIELLDEADCEQYSINRRSLEVRINWLIGSPEHAISMFESHEEACRKAFGSVCKIARTPRDAA